MSLKFITGIVLAIQRDIHRNHVSHGNLFWKKERFESLYAQQYTNFTISNTGSITFRWDPGYSNTVYSVRNNLVFKHRLGQALHHTTFNIFNGTIQDFDTAVGVYPMYSPTPEDVPLERAKSGYWAHNAKMPKLDPEHASAIRSIMTDPSLEGTVGAGIPFLNTATGTIASILYNAVKPGSTNVASIGLDWYFNGRNKFSNIHNEINYNVDLQKEFKELALHFQYTDDEDVTAEKQKTKLLPIFPQTGGNVVWGNYPKVAFYVPFLVVDNNLFAGNVNPQSSLFNLLPPSEKAIITTGVESVRSGWLKDRQGTWDLNKLSSWNKVDNEAKKRSSSSMMSRLSSSGQSILSRVTQDPRHAQSSYPTLLANDRGDTKQIFLREAQTQETIDTLKEYSKQLDERITKLSRTDGNWDADNKFMTENDRDFLKSGLTNLIRNWDKESGEVDIDDIDYRLGGVSMLSPVWNMEVGFASQNYWVTNCSSTHQFNLFLKQLLYNFGYEIPWLLIAYLPIATMRFAFVTRSKLRGRGTVKGVQRLPDSTQQHTLAPMEWKYVGDDTELSSNTVFSAIRQFLTLPKLRTLAYKANISNTNWASAIIVPTSKRVKKVDYSTQAFWQYMQSRINPSANPISSKYRGVTKRLYKEPHRTAALRFHPDGSEASPDGSEAGLDESSHWYQMQQQEEYNARAAAQRELEGEREADQLLNAMRGAAALTDIESIPDNLHLGSVASQWYTLYKSREPRHISAWMYKKLATSVKRLRFADAGVPAWLKIDDLDDASTVHQNAGLVRTGFFRDAKPDISNHQRLLLRIGEFLPYNPEYYDQEKLLKDGQEYEQKTQHAPHEAAAIAQGIFTFRDAPDNVDFPTMLTSLALSWSFFGKTASHLIADKLHKTLYVEEYKHRKEYALVAAQVGQHVTKQLLNSLESLIRRVNEKENRFTEISLPKGAKLGVTAIGQGLEEGHNQEFIKEIGAIVFSKSFVEECDKYHLINDSLVRRPNPKHAFTNMHWDDEHMIEGIWTKVSPEINIQERGFWLKRQFMHKYQLGKHVLYHGKKYEQKVYNPMSYLRPYVATANGGMLEKNEDHRTMREGRQELNTEQIGHRHIIDKYHPLLDENEPWKTHPDKYAQDNDDKPLPLNAQFQKHYHKLSSFNSGDFYDYCVQAIQEAKKVLGNKKNKAFRHNPALKQLGAQQDVEHSRHNIDQLDMSNFAELIDHDPVKVDSYTTVMTKSHKQFKIDPRSTIRQSRINSMLQDFEFGSALRQFVDIYELYFKDVMEDDDLQPTTHVYKALCKYHEDTGKYTYDVTDPTLAIQHQVNFLSQVVKQFADIANEYAVKNREIPQNRKKVMKAKAVFDFGKRLLLKNSSLGASMLEDNVRETYRQGQFISYWSNGEIAAFLHNDRSMIWGHAEIPHFGLLGKLYTDLIQHAWWLDKELEYRAFFHSWDEHKRLLDHDVVIKKYANATEFNKDKSSFDECKKSGTYADDINLAKGYIMSLIMRIRYIVGERAELKKYQKEVIDLFLIGREDMFMRYGRMSNPRNRETALNVVRELSNNLSHQNSTTFHTVPEIEWEKVFTEFKKRYPWDNTNNTSPILTIKEALYELGEVHKNKQSKGLKYKGGIVYKEGNKEDYTGLSDAQLNDLLLNVLQDESLLLRLASNVTATLDDCEMAPCPINKSRAFLWPHPVKRWHAYEKCKNIIKQDLYKGLDTRIASETKNELDSRLSNLIRALALTNVLTRVGKKTDHPDSPVIKTTPEEELEITNNPVCQLLFNEVPFVQERLREANQDWYVPRATKRVTDVYRDIHNLFYMIHSYKIAPEFIQGDGNDQSVNEVYGPALEAINSSQIVLPAISEIEMLDEIFRNIIQDRVEASLVELCQNIYERVDQNDNRLDPIQDMNRLLECIILDHTTFDVDANQVLAMIKERYTEDPKFLQKLFGDDQEGFLVRVVRPGILPAVHEEEEVMESRLMALDMVLHMMKVRYIESMFNQPLYGDGETKSKDCEIEHILQQTCGEEGQLYFSTEAQIEKDDLECPESPFMRLKLFNQNLTKTALSADVRDAYRETISLPKNPDQDLQNQVVDGHFVYDIKTTDLDIACIEKSKHDFPTLINSFASKWKVGFTMQFIKETYKTSNFISEQTKKRAIVESLYKYLIKHKIHTYHLAELVQDAQNVNWEKEQEIKVNINAAHHENTQFRYLTTGESKTQPLDPNIRIPETQKVLNQLESLTHVPSLNIKETHVTTVDDFTNNLYHLKCDTGTTMRAMKRTDDIHTDEATFNSLALLNEVSNKIEHNNWCQDTDWGKSGQFPDGTFSSQDTEKAEIKKHLNHFRRKVRYIGNWKRRIVEVGTTDEHKELLEARADTINGIRAQQHQYETSSKLHNHTPMGMVHPLSDSVFHGLLVTDTNDGIKFLLDSVSHPTLQGIIDDRKFQDFVDGNFDGIDTVYQSHFDIKKQNYAEIMATRALIHDIAATEEAPEGWQPSQANINNISDWLADHEEITNSIEFQLFLALAYRKNGVNLSGLIHPSLQDQVSRTRQPKHALPMTDRPYVWNNNILAEEERHGAWNMDLPFQTQRFASFEKAQRIAMAADYYIGKYVGYVGTHTHQQSLENWRLRFARQTKAFLGVTSSEDATQKFFEGAVTYGSNLLSLAAGQSHVAPFIFTVQEMQEMREVLGHMVGEFESDLWSAWIHAHPYTFHHQYQLYSGVPPVQKRNVPKDITDGFYNPHCFSHISDYAIPVREHDERMISLTYMGIGMLKLINQSSLVKGLSEGTGGKREMRRALIHDALMAYSRTRSSKVKGIMDGMLEGMPRLYQFDQHTPLSDPDADVVQRRAAGYIPYQRVVKGPLMDKTQKYHYHSPELAEKMSKSRIVQSSTQTLANNMFRTLPNVTIDRKPIELFGQQNRTTEKMNVDDAYPVHQMSKATRNDTHYRRKILQYDTAGPAINAFKKQLDQEIQKIESTGGAHSQEETATRGSAASVARGFTGSESGSGHVSGSGSGHGSGSGDLDSEKVKRITFAVLDDTSTIDDLQKEWAASRVASASFESAEAIANKIASFHIGGTNETPYARSVLDNIQQEILELDMQFLWTRLRLTKVGGDLSLHKLIQFPKFTTAGSYQMALINANLHKWLSVDIETGHTELLPDDMDFAAVLANRAQIGFTKKVMIVIPDWTRLPQNPNGSFISLKVNSTNDNAGLYHSDTNIPVNRQYLSDVEQSYLPEIINHGNPLDLLSYNKDKKNTTLDSQFLIALLTYNAKASWEKRAEKLLTSFGLIALPEEHKPFYRTINIGFTPFIPHEQIELKKPAANFRKNIADSRSTLKKETEDFTLKILRKQISPTAAERTTFTAERRFDYLKALNQHYKTYKSELLTVLRSFASRDIKISFDGQIMKTFAHRVVTTDSKLSPARIKYEYERAKTQNYHENAVLRYKQKKNLLDNGRNDNYLPQRSFSVNWKNHTYDYDEGGDETITGAESYWYPMIEMSEFIRGMDALSMFDNFHNPGINKESEIQTFDTLKTASVPEEFDLIGFKPFLREQSYLGKRLQKDLNVATDLNREILFGIKSSEKLSRTAQVSATFDESTGISESRQQRYLTATTRPEGPLQPVGLLESAGVDSSAPLLGNNQENNAGNQSNNTPPASETPSENASANNALMAVERNSPASATPAQPRDTAIAVDSEEFRRGQQAIGQAVQITSSGVVSRDEVSIFKKMAFHSLPECEGFVQTNVLDTYGEHIEDCGEVNNSSAYQKLFMYSTGAAGTSTESLVPADLFPGALGPIINACMDYGAENTAKFDEIGELTTLLTSYAILYIDQQTTHLNSRTNENEDERMRADVDAQRAMYDKVKNTVKELVREQTSTIIEGQMEAVAQAMGETPLNRNNQTTNTNTDESRFTESTPGQPGSSSARRVSVSGVMNPEEYRAINPMDPTLSPLTLIKVVLYETLAGLGEQHITTVKSTFEREIKQRSEKTGLRTEEVLNLYDITWNTGRSVLEGLLLNEERTNWNVQRLFPKSFAILSRKLSLYSNTFNRAANQNPANVNNRRIVSLHAFVDTVTHQEFDDQLATYLTEEAARDPDAPEPEGVIKLLNQEEQDSVDLYGRTNHKLSPTILNPRKANKFQLPSWTEELHVRRILPLEYSNQEALQSVCTTLYGGSFNLIQIPNVVKHVMAKYQERRVQGVRTNQTRGQQATLALGPGRAQTESTGQTHTAPSVEAVSETIISLHHLPFAILNPHERNIETDGEISYAYQADGQHVTTHTGHQTVRSRVHHRQIDKNQVFIDFEIQSRGNEKVWVHTNVRDHMKLRTSANASPHNHESIIYPKMSKYSPFFTLKSDILGDIQMRGSERYAIDKTMSTYTGYNRLVTAVDNMEHYLSGGEPMSEFMVESEYRRSQLSSVRAIHHRPLNLGGTPLPAGENNISRDFIKGITQNTETSNPSFIPASIAMCGGFINPEKNNAQTHVLAADRRLIQNNLEDSMTETTSAATTTPLNPQQTALIVALRSEKKFTDNADEFAAKVEGKPFKNLYGKERMTDLNDINFSDATSLIDLVKNPTAISAIDEAVVFSCAEMMETITLDVEYAYEKLYSVAVSLIFQYTNTYFSFEQIHLDVDRYVNHLTKLKALVDQQVAQGAGNNPKARADLVGSILMETFSTTQYLTQTANTTISDAAAIKRLYDADFNGGLDRATEPADVVYNEFVADIIKMQKNFGMQNPVPATKISSVEAANGETYVSMTEISQNKSILTDIEVRRKQIIGRVKLGGPAFTIPLGVLDTFQTQSLQQAFFVPREDDLVEIYTPAFKPYQMHGMLTIRPEMNLPFMLDIPTLFGNRNNVTVSLYDNVLRTLTFASRAMKPSAKDFIANIDFGFCLNYTLFSISLFRNILFDFSFDLHFGFNWTTGKYANLDYDIIASNSNIHTPIDMALKDLYDNSFELII